MAAKRIISSTFIGGASGDGGLTEPLELTQDVTFNFPAAVGAGGIARLTGEADWPLILETDETDDNAWVSLMLRDTRPGYGTFLAFDVEATAAANIWRLVGGAADGGRFTLAPTGATIASGGAPSLYVREDGITNLPTAGFDSATVMLYPTFGVRPVLGVRTDGADVDLFRALSPHGSLAVFGIDKDTALQWGAGTYDAPAFDTNLYRATADVLATDDKLRLPYDFGGGASLLFGTGGIGIRAGGGNPGLVFHLDDDGSQVVTLEASPTFTLLNAPSQWQMSLGGTEHLRLATPASDETGLLIRVDRSGAQSLSRVSIGAADSAGAGYRALRVAN
jgi:hypothetical protein